MFDILQNALYFGCGWRCHRGATGDRVVWIRYERDDSNGNFSDFCSHYCQFHIANFISRHLEKKHSVIYDCGVICVMMPTTLAGSQIGSYILIVTSAVIIQILFIILLIALSNAVELGKIEPA